MIKDSKLIVTKIAAPYGWKKFKVGELFDFVRSDTPRLGSFVSNDTVSLIKATSSNNGVDSVFKSYTGLCYKNILTIGMRGSFKVFLHTSAVVLGDNVAGFKLKDTTYSSSNRVLLFLGCLLEKLYSYGSGYAGYPTWSKLESHDALSIPVLPNSQPDFAWMEQYMKLVQEDYLKQKKLSNQAEIKAYLTESHTDSLAITDADREFLREFDKLPRRKFKVMDFLILKNSPDVHFEQKNLPLISAGDNNHGIRSWDQTFEYCNNVITISKLGQTFYYHQSVCYTDDVLGLQLPVDSILFGIYLQTVLNKQTRQISSYGHQFRMKRLDELSLLLPTSVNDEIDVASIENYMQIQVKLTIIKRKEYLDRELKLMEQII